MSDYADWLAAISACLAVMFNIALLLTEVGKLTFRPSTVFQAL